MPISINFKNKTSFYIEITHGPKSPFMQSGTSVFLFSNFFLGALSQPKYWTGLIFP